MYLSKWKIKSTCMLPDIVGFSTWMNVRWKTQGGLRFLVDLSPWIKYEFEQIKLVSDPFIFFFSVRNMIIVIFIIEWMFINNIYDQKVLLLKILKLHIKIKHCRTFKNTCYILFAYMRVIIWKLEFFFYFFYKNIKYIYQQTKQQSEKFGKFKQ